MLENLRLVRNVGLFDSISPGQQLPLCRLTLIYAENGRGKTTLAAIFRSLSNGDPQPILERHRLGAQHNPHVILSVGGALYTFQNSAWSATVPQIVVFDDHF